MLITKNIPIKEILEKLYNADIKYAYVCDMIWAIWDLLELDGFEDLQGILLPNTDVVSSNKLNFTRIIDLNCSLLKVRNSTMQSISDSEKQVCGFSVNYKNKMICFFEFNQSYFSYTEQKKEIIRNIIDYYCKSYIGYFSNISY